MIKGDSSDEIWSWVHKDSSMSWSIIGIYVRAGSQRSSISRYSGCLPTEIESGATLRCAPPVHETESGATLNCAPPFPGFPTEIESGATLRCAPPVHETESGTTLNCAPPVQV